MNDIILDVVDSMSNTPLPGATILINGVAVGETDLNGVYQLVNPNSADQITVSYVGYSPYTIAAGIIEGSAQIQMARGTDTLPTLTVTPSPASPNYLPWIIGGGVAIALLSGGKKSVGAKGNKTGLYIGAGALGLGAIYFMTRPAASAPSTPTALTTQQMVANKAAASNPLTALTSLFPSLSKLITPSTPAPGTPGSFTPVSVDTSNATSSDDISPSFDADTVDPGAASSLDFSSAPGMSGMGAMYTGKKFGRVGAKYSGQKVYRLQSNLGTDQDDDDYPARRRKHNLYGTMGDGDDDDLPQKNRIHKMKLGAIPMLLPYAAAAVGAAALLSKKKRIGDTDYSKYIIPIGIVGAGIYILSETGLFGNSANAQNNNQVASGSVSSIASAISAEIAAGGFTTLTTANYQSLANDIYNNIQSGNPNQDQVVQDVIQSNTLLDWLYIKQAFGTKSFNTGSWLSLCAVAQVNCTTVDLDSALKATLDATHIATINNYFSSQGINYSI
jgi:CarboxypepD_reg-like domain